PLLHEPCAPRVIQAAHRLVVVEAGVLNELAGHEAGMLLHCPRHYPHVRLALARLVDRGLSHSARLGVRLTRCGWELNAHLPRSSIHRAKCHQDTPTSASSASSSTPSTS